MPGIFAPGLSVLIRDTMAVSLIGADSTKIAEIAHTVTASGKHLAQDVGCDPKKRSCDSAVLGKLKVGIGGLCSDP
jgi:hypothetical protein